MKAAVSLKQKTGVAKGSFVGLSSFNLKQLVQNSGLVGRFRAFGKRTTDACGVPLCMLLPVSTQKP